MTSTPLLDSGVVTKATPTSKLMVFEDSSHQSACPTGGTPGGRRLLAAAAAFFIGASAGGCLQPVQVSSYYVCDCRQSADGECAVGDDLADGRTRETAWQSYDRARQGFADIDAGERIRFCRGGAFEVGESARWVNESCTADRPCTVTDYAPRWGGGDEMRPIIWQRSAAGHGFAFENGGAARHEEGYTFENLDVRAAVESGTAGFGFFMYNDVDDVTIRNVHVEGFKVGVHLAGSHDCHTDDDRCDAKNDRVHLVDSTVVYNRQQGWLGGSSGSTIENSYFEGNGTRAIFDHNIYVSSSAAPTEGMRIVGNRSYRSAIQPNGNCGGVSIVVHGNHAALDIIGNTVWEDRGAASEECWGIAVDPGYTTAESFTAVVISGNSVRNVGNVAIGVAACVDCTIENNTIVSEQPFGVRAIAAPNRRSASGDVGMRDVVVRSNSIYITSSEGSTGIEVGGEGTGHQVVSNAIHYAGDAKNWSCIRAKLDPSAYEAVDYNICAFPGAGAGAEWSYRSGGGRRTLERWQGRSGFDLHSRLADPGFLAPSWPDYDLTAESGGSGMVGGGEAAVSALYDFFDRLRGGSPDAGAFQWGNALRSRRSDQMSSRQRRRAHLKEGLAACVVDRSRLRRGGRGGTISERSDGPGMKVARRPIARIRAQMRKCRALLRVDRRA
jgi:hypothetical protein